MKYASNFLLCPKIIEYTLKPCYSYEFFPPIFLSLSLYNGSINGTSAFLKRYAKCHCEINNDIHVSV